IALLLRVAMALDLQLEWLLKDADPVDQDLTKLLALYQKADPTLRARIMEQLEDRQNADERAKRICLVGLRGAGKSTLGALAADRLSVPFLELNKEIETMAGMAVGEIIGLYGQEGYRKLEQDALLQVSDGHDHVMMAAAGGVVEDAETYDMLLSRFHTVWLRAAPDDHMRRVREQGDERPMAGNPAAMEQLKMLLTERQTAYARADAQLNTSGLTLDQSLEQLIALIGAKNYLS
ncbi:MAG: shikimate kinase, partial [Paracoccaceae bacterium]